MEIRSPTHSLRCTLLLLGVLLPAGLWAQSNPNTNNFDYNPPPFNKTAASPSSHIMWGLSPMGQRWLSHSNQNNAQLLVNLANGNQIGSPANTNPNGTPAFFARQGQGNCGVSFGTKFNLEPPTGDPGTVLPRLLGYNLPLPQDEEAVDFIPNAGISGSDVIVEGHNDYRGFFGALNNSVTGITVHVADSTGSPDCTPSFEMGVPQVLSPLGDGQVLLGAGDPIVRANPTNGNIYAGGLQFGFSDTAVGVFKTTAAALSSPCQPLGTTNEGDSTACLPVNRMVNTQNEFSSFTFNDKPDMAVDERPSGTGAGDVYVTDTLFNIFTGTSEIGLEVCNASLSACSPYNIVSDTSENGGVPSDQFSNIKVRPDGGISVTYVNAVISLTPSFAFVQTDFIKYISCTPNGAPAFPTCNAAQLVATEDTPLTFFGNLGSNLFRVDTYPTHDSRNDSRGAETYIVWSHCNQHQTETLAFLGECANADLMYSFANTTGNPAAPSWTGPLTFDASAGDQYMPWVRTDTARGTVNVDYYTGVDDPQFRHQYKITLAQIPPGKDSPSLNSVPAMLSVDPSGDFNFQNLFIGDYVGLAARAVAGGASRAYLAYTYNNDPGVLPDGTGNGASTTLTEENNHLRLVRY